MDSKQNNRTKSNESEGVKLLQKGVTKNLYFFFFQTNQALFSILFVLSTYQVF